MVQAWDSVILSGLHQWPLSVQQEGLERVGDTQLVLERTAGGQVGLAHRPGVRDMAPFPSPRAAGMSAYHRGGRDAGRKEARRVQGGRYRSLTTGPVSTISVFLGNTPCAHGRDSYYFQ